MCFGSRRDEDEYKKSRDIDAQIHRDEKDMQKVVKLLLLGTAPHFILHEPASPGITSANHDHFYYRCRREWEVNDIKADEIDLHQGGHIEKREGGMACHHLQQPPGRPQNDNRRYGRHGY